jgi:hypothetical protein
VTPDASEAKRRHARNQSTKKPMRPSRTKLRTKAAEKLADAAIAMTSQQWHNTAMSTPK